MPQIILDDLDTSQVSIFCAQTQRGELSSRMQMSDVVNKNHIRHGHMVNISRQIMLEGMRADFRAIDRHSQVLVEMARKSKRVTCRTAAGTDYTADLSANLRWLKTSGIITPEKWGNLPGGEIFTSPFDSNGIFVVDGVVGDYLCQKYGDIQATPLTIEIKDNRIKSLACANQELLEEFTAYTMTDENSNRVGEFAVGTNTACKDIIGNILQDEKIPGIHIAFGHPYAEHTGQTWLSKTHIDCVGRDFDIWFDDEQVMRRRQIPRLGRRRFASGRQRLASAFERRTSAIEAALLSDVLCRWRWIPTQRARFNDEFHRGKVRRSRSHGERNGDLACGFSYLGDADFSDRGIHNGDYRGRARTDRAGADARSSARMRADAIPPKLVVPNENPHPLFVQVDFAICEGENGQLTPRLIELQGFPSLYSYQLFFYRCLRATFPDIPADWQPFFSGLEERILSRPSPQRDRGRRRSGECHPARDRAGTAKDADRLRRFGERPGRASRLPNEYKKTRASALLRTQRARDPDRADL